MARRFLNLVATAATMAALIAVAIPTAAHAQQGHARAAYGDDALFVIRPDNYVGLVLADPDPAPVMGYLQRITARHRFDRVRLARRRMVGR